MRKLLAAASHSALAGLLFLSHAVAAPTTETLIDRALDSSPACLFSLVTGFCVTFGSIASEGAFTPNTVQPAQESIGTADIIGLSKGNAAFRATGITPRSNVFDALGNSMNAANKLVQLNVHEQLAPSLNDYSVNAVANNSPLNGFYVNREGSYIDICANGIGWACVSLTGPAKITSQLAEITTTYDGPANAEQGFFQLFNVKTGAANQWTPSTAYSGATRKFIKNGPHIYLLQSSSCLSAASGGPSGIGTDIADGSCTWNYYAPYSLYSPKQAYGLNVIAGPGGGITWGVASAVQLMSGFNAVSAISSEWDMSNYSGVDPYEGSGYAYTNLYLSGPIGGNPISAAIAISHPTLDETHYGAYDGIVIGNPFSIKNHAIYLNNLTSAIGYYDTASTHSVASIFDNTTSPAGINLSGIYSASAIIANQAHPMLVPTIGNISDANIPIQINAGASTASFFGANNNGAYGLLVGYDNTGTFASAGGLIRNIPNTPISFLINSSTIVAKMDSTGFTLPLLSGNGKTIACFDETGKLYRGSGTTCR